MPQNLSQLILSFLHFADNDPLDLQCNQLNKVPPLMEYWISKFQETYTPSIFINTGEERLLDKGELKFKQYIPSKYVLFGNFFFSFCEDLGYL